jgi:REP element-mobilizing transposase RayT
MRWRHVVISTYNSWLPGDPRGFRSKKHKIHSSGDYKHRPPVGEHSGLHGYSQKISGQPIVIPADLRAEVGMAMLGKIQKLKYRILVLAVAGMHTHMLIELPDNMDEIRQIIGQCKTVASHKIRDRLPGRVWARVGSFDPVDDADYQRNTYHYILRQKDAWIWSYRDGEVV